MWWPRPHWPGGARITFKSAMTATRCNTTSSAKWYWPSTPRTYQWPQPGHRTLPARDQRPTRKIYAPIRARHRLAYQGADLQQIRLHRRECTPRSALCRRRLGDRYRRPSEGTVELIDPGTDQVTGSIAVGSGSAQVAVGSDGRYAYTGTTKPRRWSKVDLIRTVVGSVVVPTAPVQLAHDPGMNRASCLG